MQNILVIKLSAFGDFIQALGPMQAIRNHYPQAHITLLTTAPYVSLAEESGYFDEVIADQRPRFFEFAKWILLRNALQETKYDHIFDLQNNDRVRKYYKPLFQKGYRWHSIEQDGERDIHAHIRHKDILKRAGINDVPLDRLEWAGKDVCPADFGITGKYMLMVPGAHPRHAGKRWPAQNYAALAQYIADKGLTPVIIGTKAEDKEADIIMRNCPQAISLIGKTKLLDIAALARHAESAIGNDTGPMHIIGPTGCKSLVLFSRHSDPKKHAPIGASVSTLSKEDLKDLALQDVIAELPL